MATTNAPPITVREYRQLPETGPRYQLVEGDLYMAPAPILYHQVISRNLESIIFNFLKTNPVGEVLYAPVDVYLSEHNVYQPDIVFVASRNLFLLRQDGIHGGPDLVIEILSPRTRELDTGVKKGVYARSGVTEYWLIDPEPKEVSIFRLQEDSARPASTHGEADVISTDLLPGLRIDLAEVFASPEIGR